MGNVSSKADGEEMERGKKLPFGIKLSYGRYRGTPFKFVVCNPIAL